MRNKKFQIFFAAFSWVAFTSSLPSLFSFSFQSPSSACHNARGIASTEQGQIKQAQKQKVAASDNVAARIQDSIGRMQSDRSSSDDHCVQDEATREKSPSPEELAAEAKKELASKWAELEKLKKDALKDPSDVSLSADLYEKVSELLSSESCEENQECKKKAYDIYADLFRAQRDSKGFSQPQPLASLALQEDLRVALLDIEDKEDKILALTHYEKGRINQEKLQSSSDEMNHSVYRGKSINLRQQNVGEAQTAYKKYQDAEKQLQLVRTGGLKLSATEIAALEKTAKEQKKLAQYYYYESQRYDYYSKINPQAFMMQKQLKSAREQENKNMEMYDQQIQRIQDQMISSGVSLPMDPTVSSMPPNNFFPMPGSMSCPNGHCGNQNFGQFATNSGQGRFLEGTAQSFPR